MQRKGAIARGTLLASAAVGLSLAFVALSPAAITSKLVSVTSAGAPAQAYSDADEGTALSSDGRLVVFCSAGANLPQGDGATRQAYVRNVKTGKTRLVSVNGQGDPAQTSIEEAAISANGRFVAFSGTGAGLPGANGQSQVWVRDLKLGKTVLASKAADGSPALASADQPALSARGRRVAFESNAPNLPGAGAGAGVFVRDLDRKRTILVSRTNGGDPASGSVYGQTISSDGTRVTFYSSDDTLPGGGGPSHTYVRDLHRGRTILADRAGDGTAADTGSGNSSISGNGRFVIFESDATNLPGAGASSNQVYVRDLKLGKTRLAGRTSAGDPQDGYAEFAHLSGNGRYAQWVANGANLPGGGGPPQVYVRDMRTGKTRLVSRAANGDPADQEATNGTISLDGRWVVFESYADNLAGATADQQVFRAGPVP